MQQEAFVSEILTKITKMQKNTYSITSFKTKNVIWFKIQTYDKTTKKGKEK